MDKRPPDPPTRPGWIRMLKPAQHATALLRQYVEIRMGSVDQAESSACRSFLKQFSKATTGGNPGGVELALRETGKADMVAIFAHVPDIGAVSWLPVILMKRSERIEHIIRETGSRLYPYAPESKPFDPWDEVEAGKRGIPPKVETKFVPGKRA
jgi:hypothetical protein